MDIPSAFRFKKEHLQGVPMIDSDGNPYPDAALQLWIDRAVEWMEHQLDIPIAELRTITERHDFHQDQNSNFGFLQTFVRPVESIESLRYVYGNSQVLDIPLDWIQLFKETGQITIVPSAGSTATIPMTGGGNLMAPWLAGTFSYMPAMIEVTYKAGFGSEVIEGTARAGGSDRSLILEPTASRKDNLYAFSEIELVSGPLAPMRANALSYDGFLRKLTFEPGTFAQAPDGCGYRIERRLIPGDIIEVIVYRAQIGLLTVIGEFILGAGIASQSISMDGLSESINTTQSAEFDTYGARIKSCRDFIKDTLPILKRRYSGFYFTVL